MCYTLGQCHKVMDTIESIAVLITEKLGPALGEDMGEEMMPE